MNSDSIIIFENVFKSYKGEEVLENIDFKVKRGEFVFLIGPSGAGKSTIIKLLNREEFPTSGKIFIDGTDLSTVPFEEMHKIRRKIGVVFQDFRVIKSKNVFENVAISLEVVNSPTDVIQEVVPNILGMVGLQNKIYKNPSELSGGEVQRLIIARALAHEPDIIVADEPTGMIDPRATGEIMNLLNEINKMGTTVLMATHDYNIVNHYKKRVLKIDNGKIVSDKKGGTYHD
jgi:cell division transport system ATP-binding protein